MEVHAGVHGVTDWWMESLIGNSLLGRMQVLIHWVTTDPPQHPVVHYLSFTLLDPSFMKT
jgi:hypothetical protein